MRLIIEPVWSWPLVVVAAAAMLGLVLWTYPARVRQLSSGWRATLIALRLLAALLLIFAMLRPSLQFSETDRRRSEITVLLDKSRSMTTPDAPGGLTRREWLVKLLQDHQEAWKKLAEEADLKLVDFSDDLQPVETPNAEADGSMTAIGKAIEQVREQERGDRLVCVLLLSDGAERIGGDNEVTALTAARRLAEQKGVPIHTIVFGTSELSTSGLDYSIEDLTLDQPVTFEKKTVPVKLQLRLLGAAGKNVRVRLLMEDRTGKALGESGPLVPIPFSGDAVPSRELRTRENSVLLTVELSFVAERAGEYKIAAEVVPEEGEVKRNNNSLETLITVRKGGLRVAYFDTLRTEQKFLRRLNETAKIQLDTQFVVSNKPGSRTLIDPKLFEPGAYDVYLIGDLPADVFQARDRNLLSKLADRVREGAGLGMLGGQHNFGAGGYAATPLREFLPVKMSVDEKIGPNEISPRNHIPGPLRMIPTREGTKHYLMRLSAAGSDQVWNELPELGGANRLVPSSGAVTTYAATETGAPLLIAGDSGRGRVLALGVDETWKWQLHGFESEHQRFWQQLVLWLARKEFDTEQPVWVRVEPRNFPPLMGVPIEFGAQDEKGVPIAGADYDVEVIKPSGEVDKITPQRLGDGGLAQFSQAIDPGDYWVRVAAMKGGQSLGPTAMTRFIIDSRDVELDNPSADPGLMSEIAGMTGGTILAPEDFGTFLTSLVKEGIPAELKRYRRISLWDGWPLLLVFVGLLSLEWTLRKIKGLV